MTADLGAVGEDLPVVVVARGPEAVEQLVDGDTVVYVPSTEKMVLLDPVATQVWAQLATPLAMTELCQRLAEQFDVDVAQVASDLVVPFDTLVRNGVLTATVEPAGVADGA